METEWLASSQGFEVWKEIKGARDWMLKSNLLLYDSRYHILLTRSSFSKEKVQQLV